MTKIRVTKEFNFEIAHALWNYDGACKNIHGHSYKLFVTLIGEPNKNISDSKLGMVIDFGVLKKLITKNIVDKFDHALILNSNSPVKKLEKIDQMFNKIEIVNYQPTCENLVIDLVERIKKLLPKKLKLFRLKLHETGTSFAEWYASDNE